MKFGDLVPYGILLVDFSKPTAASAKITSIVKEYERIHLKRIKLPIVFTKK